LWQSETVLTGSKGRQHNTNGDIRGDSDHLPVYAFPFLGENTQFMFAHQDTPDFPADRTPTEIDLHRSLLPSVNVDIPFPAHPDPRVIHGAADHRQK